MLEIKENESLAKHSTFSVGGAALFGAVAHDVSELQEALNFAREKKIPWRVLGGGSNLLVSDDGFPGLIIWYQNRDVEIDGGKIVAGAGAITAAVAGASVRAGLTGFEWAAGVPGTIGGAAHGNAGATGGEMKDSIASVSVLEDGEIKNYDAGACEFSYRHSIFKNKPGAIILSVTLKLAHAEDTTMPVAKMREVLEYRIKTQPKGVPSSGCTFKNVEIDDSKLVVLRAAGVPEQFLAAHRIPAGWLIEAAGLKGKNAGAAYISPVHGNFIVPAPGATASDIALLIDVAKEKVAAQFGLELHEEITRLNI
ncbi:MAG: UDP-N-acetylmuramate dehydrogenase [Candidatus Magasanikbacteria bacterium]|nr:UDP-N-acetylmuramate dehydrogenase [Candidatus Magasanikbacteria bacterium]